MLSDEILQPLKAKYDSIYVREAAGETVVLRCPNRPEWKAFQLKLADAKKHVEAVEWILRQCVVYPSAEEVDAMFNRRPGLVATFGAELSEITGAAASVEKKDL